MGIFLLSTLARVRKLANQTGTASDDDLSSALSAASAAIISYMSREIKVDTYTESLWPNPSGISFLKGFPVRSLTSVSVSTGGGSYNPLTPPNYWLEDDNELHYPCRLPSRNPLKVSYVGGLVYSVDTSVESVSGVTGTPVPGSFVTGSGVAGTLVSYDSVGSAATLQITFGALAIGDTVTGTGWSFNLGATVQESLISDYPDLARACDMQAAYQFQRRNSLGRTAVTSGNGQTTFTEDYKLLPGVVQILEFYDPQLRA